MNLKEEFKKYEIMHIGNSLGRAFKAGAEWVLDNCYADGNSVELDKDIDDGLKEYINGNFESSENFSILDEGHSRST